MLNRIGGGGMVRVYVERTAEGRVCKIANPMEWEALEMRLEQTGALLATCAYQSRELAFEVIDRFSRQSQPDAYRALQAASGDAYSCANGK